MTVINKGTSVNKENRVRNPLLILKSWCITIFFNNEIIFYYLPKRVDIISTFFFSIWVYLVGF